MQLQSKNDIEYQKTAFNQDEHNYTQDFSKDYLDFLNEGGWVVERNFRSNQNNYSDLLEDKDLNYIKRKSSSTKHYRRDLDAIS